MSAAGNFSRRAQWAAGQPISRLMHLALANPELISLAAGFVDQATLPVEAARQAAERVLLEPAYARAALQYGTTAGDARLRELVLDRFRHADGLPHATRGLAVDQVLLTAGSNQLLYLVAEALLDPGDIVLCAAPSYFVFLGILGSLGARAIGVASDERGLIPAALEEQLRRLERTGELDRVKAIYVTSYFDNPSSVSLSIERRPEVVEIAQRWTAEAKTGGSKIYVIEDTAYRDLRYAGEDLPSLRSFDEAGDTVIVAETFSKSFSPGIRVGWGILPPALVEPVSDLKGNIDFGSPHFAQRLMTAVLELGLWEPHVTVLRRSYQAKMEAMLAAADTFLANVPGVSWRRPSGGLYVWLRLPEGLDAGPSGSLFDAALAEGVIYVPGEYCFPSTGQAVAKNTIRMSFGVQSPEQIFRGVEALARAIRRAAVCVAN
jgi:2-aminoadipate transaminase